MRKGTYTGGSVFPHMTPWQVGLQPSFPGCHIARIVLMVVPEQLVTEYKYYLHAVFRGDGRPSRVAFEVKVRGERSPSAVFILMPILTPIVRANWPL